MLQSHQAAPRHRAHPSVASRNKSRDRKKGRPFGRRFLVAGAIMRVMQASESGAFAISDGANDADQI